MEKLLSDSFANLLDLPLQYNQNGLCKNKAFTKLDNLHKTKVIAGEQNQQFSLCLRCYT